jgi:hypothetical protein
MGIKSFIRNWLNSDEAARPEKALGLEPRRGVTLGHINKEELGDGPSTRFDVIDAMNGRLIRCSTFKHNPHGPDWTHTIYIMEPGQSVGDAINLLLMTRG